jgi:hypothetical protein
MGSDNLAFPTVQELRTGYAQRGTVRPFFGTFPNKKQHVEEMGTAKAFTIRAVGDLTAKKLGVADTEKRHAMTDSAIKTFNKEFYNIKYEINSYQNKDHVNDLNIIVSDKLLMQQDAALSAGSGGNNGLFVSSDPDYVTIGSQVMTDYATIQAVIYAQLEANKLLTGNGAKRIAFYGTMIPLVNTIAAAGNGLTILNLLQVAFPDVTFVFVPTHATTSGNGFFILNDGLITLNYTLLAGVKNAGVNEEDGYGYINYDYGTMMLELMAPGAIAIVPKA